MYGTGKGSSRERTRQRRLQHRASRYTGTAVAKLNRGKDVQRLKERNRVRRRTKEEEGDRGVRMARHTCGYRGSARGREDDGQRQDCHIMIDMAGCRRHGHMLFPGAATSPRLALLLMPVAIRARSGPSSLQPPTKTSLNTIVHGLLAVRLDAARGDSVHTRHHALTYAGHAER